MKRCLNERALVRVHTGDGTSAEREHLRHCAVCAARYGEVAEDLQLLQRVLAQAPPARARIDRPAWSLPWRWAPVAVAVAAVLALAVRVPWRRDATLAPVQVAARASAVSAFAADVSVALFAGDDTRTSEPLALNDAPYLQAALDTGSACTPERYLGGDCDDQLSALVLEND